MRMQFNGRASALQAEDASPILVIRSIKKGKVMFKIVFEYCDTYSNWEWRRQECVMSSIDECIRVYGLGVDCDYRIISVEPVE